MPRTRLKSDDIGDGQVVLTVDVTGVLPIANGGTASTTKALAYDAIVYPSITLCFYSTSAVAVAATIGGQVTNAVGNGKLTVPAGQTFKVTHMWGTVRTGATVGANYDIKAGIWDESTATTLQTVLNQSNDTNVPIFASGTLATPLASVAAGTTIRLWFENTTGSTGAWAAGPHIMYLTGVFV